MYTKQLLLGLEYLHNNGIIQRYCAVLLLLLLILKDYLPWCLSLSFWSMCIGRQHSGALNLQTLVYPRKLLNWYDTVDAISSL